MPRLLGGVRGPQPGEALRATARSKSVCAFPLRLGTAEPPCWIAIPILVIAEFYHEPQVFAEAKLVHRPGRMFARSRSLDAPVGGQSRLLTNSWAVIRGTFFTDSAIRNPQIPEEKKSLMDGKKSGGWVSVHGRIESKFAR